MAELHGDDASHQDASHADGSAVRMAVAANMRRARRVRGLSLRDLAGLTGLSAALLSQIERQVANPTVAVLARLATALELSFAELTRAVAVEPVVVRAEHVGDFDSPRARMVFAEMERRRFDLSEGVLPAHQSGVFSDHGRGSVEYGYVVAGSVTLVVEEQTYVLRAGDAIRFNSAARHAYSTGDEPATLLTVVSYADD